MLLLISFIIHPYFLILCLQLLLGSYSHNTHEEVVNYMWERPFLHPIQPRHTARLRHILIQKPGRVVAIGCWISMIEVASSIFDKEWRMKKVSHTALQLVSLEAPE